MEEEYFIKCTNEAFEKYEIALGNFTECICDVITPNEYMPDKIYKIKKTICPCQLSEAGSTYFLFKAAYDLVVEVGFEHEINKYGNVFDSNNYLWRYRNQLVRLGFIEEV